MNIFKNKILIKLIASICIFLTLINFGLPQKVFAEDDEVWGGILIKPITKLLTSIADGIMSILHRSLLKQEVSLITISGADTWWNQWGKFVISIIIAVVVIVIAVATFWSGVSEVAAAGILAGLAKVVAASVVTGTAAVSGYYLVQKLDNDLFERDIYVPVYNFTAEEIFSNKIPLFDINFFNPMGEYMYENIKGNVSLYGEKTMGIDSLLSGLVQEGWTEEERQVLSNMFFVINQFLSVKPLENRGVVFYTVYDRNNDIYEILFFESNQMKARASFTKVAGANQVDMLLKEVIDGEESFAHSQRLLDGYGNTIINFCKEYQQEDLMRKASTAGELQEMVSTWFFILRNLALLVLMLVLIYVGIKIVTGSTAGEKAKYKERLKDWLVSICLIFIMQYIMVFSVELVAKIVELVDSSVGERGWVEIIGLSKVQTEKYKEEEDDESESSTTANMLIENGVIEVAADGTSELYWKTNLLGAFRIKAQLVNEGTAKWVGYSLCYMILVLQTLFFAWSYLKRIIYMAFLTIIAPLVAMTYPIDKMNDGKAQAFEAWLKEYIFNLLIQPMHLLLYIVLISAAYELAATNPIYAVVALGFMMPAEKLIRRFFGFDKAKTPGMLGGAAGAALAFSGMQKLMNMGKDKSKKDDNKNKKDEIKFKSPNGVNPFEAMGGKKSKGDKQSATKIKDNKTPANDSSTDKSSLDSKLDNKQEDNSEIHTRDQQNDENGQEETNESGKENEDNSSIHTKEQQTDEQEKGQSDEERQGNEDVRTKEQQEEDKGGKEEGKSKENEQTEEKQQDKTNDEGKSDQNGKKPGEGQDTNKKGFVRRVWGTNMAIAGAYTGLLVKKAKRNIAKGKPVRALARGAVGLAGATAFGMAGLALGVAGGDPSKAFQYGTAGVVGGYKAGKGLAGSAYDTLSVDKDKIKDEAEMAWYGDEYKKVMFERQQKELVNDEKKIDFLRKVGVASSREKAQQILGTTGAKCLESGINNEEDIATIHKMTTEKGVSIEKAIAAQKFNQQLPSDLNKMGQDERESHIKRWAKQYEEAGYENPEELSEDTMDLAELFNSTKSGLKKVKKEDKDA